MADEVSSSITEEVKTASDGTVKIAVEKYNELLEKITDQKGSIHKLNEKLNEARNAPPIHRTVVEKTAEMLAEEQRMWGGTFMGLGASLFVVGAFLYNRGNS